MQSNVYVGFMCSGSSASYYKIIPVNSSLGLIFRALAISSTVSAMIILSTLKLITDIWKHNDIASAVCL